MRPIAIDDADSIIRSFHLTLHEQPCKAPPIEIRNGEPVELTEEA